MKKYKIVREYIVEAKTKSEAMENFRNCENELDECVSFNEWIENVKSC